MREPLGQRIKHAWSAFTGQDTPQSYSHNYGRSYGSRPDRKTLKFGNEQSIIASIYTRLCVDVAAVGIQHVRVDENKRYSEKIISGLQECLTVQANIDQSGRAFIQDVAMSLFDEGVVAIVPVETTLNPKNSGMYDIRSLRTGQVIEWYPQHVRVRVYNEKKGAKEEIILSKNYVAIIENPLFAVMNEPNSTLKRLIHKLNLLDSIDEQSGSGKLDLIFQLPYVIKTQARREQAELRRKDIEGQLAGSKYGIAYTDGAEKVTQLNRPAENNLMSQITYLTSMLYSQLGLTEAVFDGTADEKVMLNYYNRTIEPVLSAICDGMHRVFLTKTARTQGQAIMFFREPFKLVPVNDLAEIADKFTRNEILSPNELRAVIGYKPVKNPEADELRNRNLNQSKDEEAGEGSLSPVEKEEEGVR